MRAARLVPTLLLVALITPANGPGMARAAELPAVTLRLADQSPWNGPRRPLVVSFDATNNTDQPLQDLSVTVSIFSPARSRSLYELSLRQDATAVLSTVPYLFGGTLEPGQTRRFRIKEPLDQLGPLDETALFPVTVDFRSADASQAVLRTPMVFLIEHPEVPLQLSWTWVLDTPQQVSPDGVVQPGALPSALGPDGRIGAMAAALDALDPAAMDLAVSPVLLDQLVAMQQGFRFAVGGEVRTVAKGTDGAEEAGRILGMLRRVAGRPETELVALPWGDARLPSLIRSGLSADIAPLVQAGRNRVSDVLGTAPDPSVFRPPVSQIEPASASVVRRLGVRVLLVDPSTVPVDASLPFGPPSGSARPIVRLPGNPTLWTVTPDPGVLRAASQAPDDPRLAAQAALGELAAVWLEFPGTPGRGAAVMFSEASSLAPTFFGAFAGLVSRSPWLQRIRATDLLGSAADAPEGELQPRTYRSFSDPYLADLADARRSVALLERTVVGARPLIDRLRSQLLEAEGGVAVSNPRLGTRYIDAVTGAIDRLYRGIRATNSRFTLTSRQASLPLAVSNAGSYAVRVTVRMLADRRLRFPTGNVREVSLAAKQTALVSVPVQALATGRFPVKVQILTPGEGPQALIAESDLVVRSTAYNRIALALTIGAALFLFTWWGRRFLPKRRRAGERTRDHHA
ncbi:MAG TPA: DUF6049 family protein [Actinomycetota bacterium]|nr:DUF6049 family protein [Actinomycetota bacterium]